MSRHEIFPVKARPFEIEQTIAWLRSDANDWIRGATRSPVGSCAIGKLYQFMGVDPPTTHENLNELLFGRFGLTHEKVSQIVSANDLDGRYAAADEMEKLFPLR